MEAQRQSQLLLACFLREFLLQSIMVLQAKKCTAGLSLI
jgi:hypothetical protein